MKYIKSFDYLSHEARLTFSNQGDTRLKTFYGGLLSTLSILIISILGIYFLVNFLQKSNKYSITSTESSPYLNLTNSNKIPFLFRLSNGDSVPYNNTDKLYNIIFRFWNGGTNSTEKTIDNIKQRNENLQIEKCNLSHFGDYQNLFENITDLNTFYCPIIRNYNQTLYGIYGNVLPFSYYYFYFQLCDYDNDKNCYSLSEIENLLSDCYLDMRTINYEIDSESKEVKKSILKSDRFMISLTIHKRIWIFFNSVKYITDIGFFFNIYNEESFFQYDSTRYDIDLRETDIDGVSRTFLGVTIATTGHTLIFTRKFNKIEDYIATFSGIIKAVTMLVFSLNYFHSQNNYYFNLIHGYVLPEEEVKLQFKKKYNYTKSSHDNLNVFIDKNHHNGNNLNLNSERLKNKNRLNSFISSHLPSSKRNSVAVSKVNLIFNNEQNKYIKILKNSKNKMRLLGYILPFLIYSQYQTNKEALLFCFERINQHLNIVNVLKKLAYSDLLMKYSLELQSKTIDNVNNKGNENLHKIFSTIRKKNHTVNENMNYKNNKIKIPQINIKDNNVSFSSSSSKFEINTINSQFK